MKKTSFSIIVSLTLCLLFLSSGISFSADYVKIANKTVTWKTFEIKAGVGWLGLDEKDTYSLVYNFGNEYGAIILSDIKSSFSKKKYREFLKKTYEKLASDPSNKNVTFSQVTPYKVLGMKNAPAVVFLAKEQRFFTFLPYVDHYAYSIVAVSWHKDSSILPLYLIEMLENISVKTPASRQSISKVKKPVEAEKAFTDPTTGMEFVFVPGGCFQMGDTFGNGGDNERPVHKVCVDSFYMGKYEVTQGQYRKITGSNPSDFKKGDRWPVENVSWRAALAFIRKLNEKSDRTYRLPTEAEWEYAARSGGKKEYYAGSNKVDDVGNVTWYRSNSAGSTHEVGTKAPNGLGLYDMSGNVQEWCRDWYRKDYYQNSPQQNPTGPSSGRYERVVRGGSCGVGTWNVRAAYREGFDVGDAFSGFRLVLPSQKSDSRIKSRNKALPVKTSENISNTTSKSAPVQERKETASHPVKPHHKTIKSVPSGTCYAKYFKGLTAENADLDCYNPARNGKKAYSITAKGGGFVMILYGDDQCFTMGKWKVYYDVGEEQSKYDLIDKKLTMQAITNFTADAPKVRQRLLDDLSKAEKATLDYKSTHKRFKDNVKWDSGGYKLELWIKSTSVQTVKLLVTIN